MRTRWDEAFDMGQAQRWACQTEVDLRTLESQITALSKSIREERDERENAVQSIRNALLMLSRRMDILDGKKTERKVTYRYVVMSELVEEKSLYRNSETKEGTFITPESAFTFIKSKNWDWNNVYVRCVEYFE